jgi:hypothetical protein
MLFVSSLIGDLLSWPVIMLVIFFMIKGPVRELIPRLKSFEGMGQKLTFGEQLAATEETAAAAVLLASYNRRSRNFESSLTFRDGFWRRSVGGARSTAQRQRT